MPAYKDKKSGKWYCKFYYKDWIGNPKQKWKRGFRTKREAMQYERDFLQRQSSSSSITLGNLYHIYIEEMKTRLKRSTLETKQNICQTKILPYFADKPMNELTALDVRRWQNTLLKEKQYSETYLKTINNQLTAIVNYARRYYNLCTNPCEQAGSIGTSAAKEMEYWTLNEYITFRKGLKNRLAAYTCLKCCIGPACVKVNCLHCFLKILISIKKRYRLRKHISELRGRMFLRLQRLKKASDWFLFRSFYARKLKVT